MNERGAGQAEDGEHDSGAHASGSQQSSANASSRATFLWLVAASASGHPGNGYQAVWQRDQAKGDQESRASAMSGLMQPLLYARAQTARASLGADEAELER